jgi:hypothetical protein
LITVIVRATIVTSNDDRFCCPELDRSPAAALVTAPVAAPVRAQSTSAKQTCHFSIFPSVLRARFKPFAARVTCGFVLEMLWIIAR